MLCILGILIYMTEEGIFQQQVQNGQMLMSPIWALT